MSFFAQKVHNECIRRKKRLALAESCTGGALAARLTAIPGASLYFLGSIVAYAPQWKERFLHVSPVTSKESEEAVREMVAGLFAQTEADYAVAVSGFAGPTGAFPGSVFIGIGERGHTIESIHIQIKGTRMEVIESAVDEALQALLQKMSL